MRFEPLHAHDRDRNSIVVHQVSVSYGDVVALDDVSLDVAGGERVAVVGPNGSGKSTLFKVIAGVIQPQRGRVDLFGTEPREHICVAYVPQRSQVDWSFPVNVQDVVMMGRVGRLGLLRWPSRRDVALVRECLEKVVAIELSKRQIGELSGGQQQRVFIARALAQQAEVVLLDEPMTGLDVGSQTAIYGILDTLRAMQVTVLLSTHDLNQAAQCFGRVLLLNRSVFGYGPASQVLSSERLVAAYGDQLRLEEIGDGVLAFSDTACSGGGDGHVDHR